MNLELLAPAGSYESLTAAIQAGADAVYIGGSKFGARAYAKNLSEEQLIEAIQYVHLHGKKLYLTVNTLLKEDELSKELYEYLKNLYVHGLDGVIVQDTGVLSFIREHFPQLPIHASTQMSITGEYGAEFLEEQGVSRVVTSRELSLDEIRKIHEHTNLEIESFVHGALCYCYSGQCLYSSLIGGRSGNRGRCAQPCRLPYDVIQDGKTLTTQGENYVLSPKDICTLDILDELIKAGVTSFKIEGRMKKPEYTAGVVQIYRKYLDQYKKNPEKEYKVLEEDKKKLMDLYNRGGFSQGYYVSRNGRKMISLSRPNHFGTYVGTIASLSKKQIGIKLLEDVSKGDVLEIMGRGKEEKLEFTVKEDGKKGENLKISSSFLRGVSIGNKVNRTRNTKLIKEIQRDLEEKIKEKINGKLILSQDFPAILYLSFGSIEIEVTGDFVTKAMNRPLTEEVVRKQMQKTGNTPFEFEELLIEMEEEVFLPVQSLNELRRNALEELEQRINKGYLRALPSEEEKQSKKEDRTRDVTSQKVLLNVSIEKLEYLPVVLEEDSVHSIYLDSVALSFPLDKTMAQVVAACHEKGKKCYLILPAIFRMDTAKLFSKNWDCIIATHMDGVVVKNLEEFEFLKKYGYDGELIIDHNVYTFNHQAMDFWKSLNIAYDTVPLELNKWEAKERGCKESEYVVYGYLPMMVSAQCIRKTMSGCSKVSGELILKDRKKKEFHVKNYCDYCYNIIYNSEPMILYDKRKELLSLQPRSVRLQFTLESVGEVKKILKEAVESMVCGKEINIPSERKYTRGHFKRGIE